MSERLRVNPIECSAHGMCAELVPERVTLDDWGYPIIDGAPLTEDLIAHARRAVDACPVFALKLDRQARGSNAPRRHQHASTPEQSQR